MIASLAVTRMTEDHIGPVRELELACFDKTWPEEAFLKELRHNGAACYLVAMGAGRVLGYAGAWLVFDEAHVIALAVHPEVRGQGLGRRLFWHLVREAVDRGCEWSTLEVREDNLPAQALYRSFGYDRAGIRRAYYEGRHDALVLRVEGLQTPAYRERLDRLAGPREVGP